MGLVRLWLALCVASAHIQNLFFPNAEGTERLFFSLGGGRAVMLFFIVSGFLMSFVLEEKYSGPGGALAFYRARFLRIYPLWWAMFTIMIVFFAADFVRQPFIDNLINFGLVGLDWRIALTTYPQPYSVAFHGSLGIGWSLAPEIAFYLIAPFVLRSLKLSVAVLAASVAFRYSVLQDVLYGPKWACLVYVWFPGVAMFFMMGHFARLIWKAIPFNPRFGLILLPVAAICIWQAPFGYFDSPWFYAAASCFALALPPLFACTKENGFCNAAGDLTYPLYLTHEALITAGVLMVASFIPRSVAAFALLPVPTFWQMVAMIVVGNAIFLLGAFAASRLLERPSRAALDAALTWRSFRRPPPHLAT